MGFAHQDDFPGTCLIELLNIWGGGDIDHSNATQEDSSPNYGT